LVVPAFYATTITAQALELLERADPAVGGFSGEDEAAGADVTIKLRYANFATVTVNHVQ